jgi:SPX domain protein involved in polyphosphate accumulation
LPSHSYAVLEVKLEAQTKEEVMPPWIDELTNGP